MNIKEWTDHFREYHYRKTLDEFKFHYKKDRINIEHNREELASAYLSCFCNLPDNTAVYTMNKAARTIIFG